MHSSAPHFLWLPSGLVLCPLFPSISTMLYCFQNYFTFLWNPFLNRIQQALVKIGRLFNPCIKVNWKMTATRKGFSEIALLCVQICLCRLPSRPEHNWAESSLLHLHQSWDRMGRADTAKLSHLHGPPVRLGKWRCTDVLPHQGWVMNHSSQGRH